MINLERICERCERAKPEWTVHEARIDVGRIQRKPMLCDECTTVIELAVGAALRHVNQLARAEWDRSDGAHGNADWDLDRG